MSHSDNKQEPSRDLGRLMLMMRRLVKEEFTATIHLDETDAVQELLAFSDRSRNSLLRQMARELESLLGLPRPEEPKTNLPKPATAANYYRGAAVPVKPDPSGSPETTLEVKKMVYRGQVVR